MPSFIQKLFGREAAGASTVPAPGAIAAAASSATADCRQHRLSWRGGEVIGDDEITVGRLLSLFRQVYIPVETSSDGSRLMLRLESGMRIIVTPYASRQLIAIAAVFRLKADAPLDVKLAAANRLNDQVIFLRAAVVDGTTLCLDHQMVCDGGVLAAAVVGAVRRVDRIAPRALRQCFPGELFN